MKETAELESDDEAALVDESTMGGEFSRVRENGIAARCQAASARARRDTKRRLDAPSKNVTTEKQEINHTFIISFCLAVRGVLGSAWSGVLCNEYFGKAPNGHSLIHVQLFGNDGRGSVGKTSLSSRVASG